MVLHHAFETTAARLADKVALVSGVQRITYAQLQRRVHSLAHALRDDGITPGDRVLVLLENSIEYAIAVHAVLAAGAVFVPVSPLAKPDKIGFIASDTRAVALLTAAPLAEWWRPVLQRASTLLSCRVLGDAPASDDDARVRAWPDAASAAPVASTREAHDLAALIYTSGTTGVPKGVMLSHDNIASAWSQIQAYLGLREDDVIGLVLPAAFSYGLTNLMMGLALGATVVIERTAAFPVKLAEMLARERVTVLPGVPTLFAALVGLQALARFDLSALRVVTNAAAALPPAHLQRLREAFPQAQVFSMYGLTECIRASYLPPHQLDRRPARVGRGLPQQEHWLVDELGQRLPDGAAIGELVVRGPHVMGGYWERPAETAQRLKPATGGAGAALHTGDLFRRDDDGFLYFVARKDDIIKTRGEKVAPREVENAIYQIDAVTGCAVVGVADAELGEAVKAYVTLAPGSRVGERDIIKHCLARLENYMAPRFVEIVDELPRTESGKIRHASLR